MTLNISQYMRAVPAMDRFLTVDELNRDLAAIAEQHPDLATWERVGSSQLGEPISMLTIGEGERDVLFFACPHPNEPIGAMVVHQLAHTLVKDASLRNALGFRWNFIACVDPDGTRLNEAWFAGPFTISNYARNFYRPAGHRQVEWTFPNNYKSNYFDRSLPETQMLMRVIDRLKPTLMGSLHNAGFGGVYYYILQEMPELWETYQNLPALENMALSLGEPEVPYAEEYAPAIFKLLSTADTIDFLEANGGDISDLSHGGSSSEYAAQYGTQTMMIEMGYFDDPRVNDKTVTEVSRRESILKGLDLSHESYDFADEVLEIVRDDLKTDSIFENAVSWFVKSHKKNRDASRTWAENDPETDRPATVAEVFSNDQETRFYRLLIIGMLLRMLEGEIATGNGTPKIREQAERVGTTFERWASELENDLDVRAVPIRNLVSVQLGAILATAAHMGGTLYKISE